MNFYEEAIKILLHHETTRAWPELHRACERALGHKPVAWHFPVKACEAVGGKSVAAVPAIAAISCAHMAIMLVDDILDDDPRGAYRQIGVGRAANLASGLYGLGLDVLLSSHCGQRELTIGLLSNMVLHTAYGQDLDVHNPQSEEGYWAVAKAKSSPYFACALGIGAAFGGAQPTTLDEMRRFGGIYGEMMQIHDDLNDCLASPANIDWAQGRSPLPILFAQLVDHPDRERFVELRPQVSDEAKLQEAQSILVRCGAISYSVSELIGRHARASQLVEEMDLVNAEPLKQLLEESIAPVRHLFAKVGLKMPATTLLHQVTE
jgi:geranylgeranyl pyrophosphate synthase